MREKTGPVMQKVLLLLQGGVALGLTGRPDRHFRILKDIRKEWKTINHRSLREAIKKSYQSKLIDYKENNDGTITLVLSDAGKNKALIYNLDMIAIKKPARWDGLWRMVLFDIPEHKKQARNALSAKL